jgi:CheY-like chemotaxis protein
VNSNGYAHLSPSAALETDFIFLAEDDIDDQELLIEAIKAEVPHLHVHVVNNGNKAITFLNQLPDGIIPCLIIVDFNLPEVNGPQIIHSISSSKKFDNVAKVVWSTSDSPVFKRECMDVGAKAYMVKPSTLEGMRKLAQLMLGLCGSTSN